MVYFQLLLGLSVLPGLFLLFRIYKLDAIEKEPTRLLLKIFCFGALTTISASILELSAGWLITFLVTENSIPYHLINCFLIIAVAEELGKFLVMKLATWKNPAFDYRFDAIVYAVCSSLGFAILENIVYVFGNGVATGLFRAVLSVPGHVVFSIFMGYFYGEARLCRGLGDDAGVKRNMILSLLVPVFLHGFYDFCLFSGRWYMYLAFLFFVVVLYFYTFKVVKRLAAGDVVVDYAENTTDTTDNLG